MIGRRAGRKAERLLLDFPYEYPQRPVTSLAEAQWQDWGFEEWVDVYTSRRPDEYITQLMFKMKPEFKQQIITGVTG